MLADERTNRETKIQIKEVCGLEHSVSKCYEEELEEVVEEEVEEVCQCTSEVICFDRPVCQSVPTQVLHPIHTEYILHTNNE